MVQITICDKLCLIFNISKSDDVLFKTMSYVTYLIILISLNENYQHIGKVFSICKKTPFHLLKGTGMIVFSV